MNKNKAKGTAAETAFVRYLQQVGIPAERRSLSGNKDKGDVSGIPGVVIEIKSGHTLKIPQWLKELEAEMENAKAEKGFLVIKPKGIGKVEKWWVIQLVKQIW